MSRLTATSGRSHRVELWEDRGTSQQGWSPSPGVASRASGTYRARIGRVAVAVGKTYTCVVRARVPFAAIGFVCVGVVVGFVLGGVAPRLEVQERDERIVELERELEAADTGGWRSPVPGFDRILRAPEQARVDEAPPPEGRPLPREGELAPPPEASAPLDGGVEAPRGRWRERWHEDAPQDRMVAFRRAASLQRVRRMQSRAALFQQADLNEAEQQEVDRALAEMNEELYGHGEELLMLAMGERPPEARDLLGITHDVTGILHRAQLRLEGVLGPERAGGVDPSALEIWNHVDLAQLEPAARSAMQSPR